MKKHRNHHIRRAIILGSLTALLAGLALFAFDVFEQLTQHGIMIASLGSTTLLVVLNPAGHNSSPRAIVSSYLVAGLVGLGAAQLDVPNFVAAALAVGATTLVMVLLDTAHAPAAAYSLAYVYSGYGFVEFLFLIPALLGFFIALGTLAFLVQGIARGLGLQSDVIEDKRPKRQKKLERFVSNLIPYALVALFFVLVLEIAHADVVAPYATAIFVFDWAIILLFAIDLAYKYRRQPNPKKFVMQYWPEIIATIPFFFAFRFVEGVVRILSFEGLFAAGGSELLRFGRFLKPVARFPRFARMLKEFEEHVV